MQRLATVLAATMVSLTGLFAGTALAGERFEGYTQPGVWFSPGEMYSSYYDWCGWWKVNTFSKSTSAHGLITFIDVNGNWRYGVQGTGVLRRELTFGERTAFTKKPHCRNNSGTTYQGGCYAIIETTYCA